MNKKKLGTILATIGGIGLLVCFIMFTLGGFLSVKNMSPSKFTIIGFIGFAISMVLLSLGFGLRNSGDIREIVSTSATNNMDKMIEVGKNISEKFSNINKTKCPYCGTIYNSGETKCPNCGSSLKK